ncbi:MAG: helix-turn-helix domain-containing protein [Bacteroidales bacterium]|nr:helix-turn-helix domain-containing protein [Bacteroidales bacterium]
MNKNKIGRPVDISGININEIEVWMNYNKLARKLLICQSIIALNNDVPMKEVCNVLGVTRESVRLWKEQLRREGLKGLLKEKKVGKRSKLNEMKTEELREIVRLSPKRQGYKTKKWTGLLVQDLVLEKWEFKISLRTAQLWLSKTS